PLSVRSGVQCGTPHKLCAQRTKHESRRYHLVAMVTLIGAGPGDPELLTRKAWRILGQADVVLYDALLNAAGMQQAAPEALWLSVGKRAGKTSVDQEFICRALVGYARQGMNVVRLKGGDPALFGRAAEELEACRLA